MSHNHNKKQPDGALPSLAGVTFNVVPHESIPLAKSLPASQSSPVFVGKDHPGGVGIATKPSTSNGSENLDDEISTFFKNRQYVNNSSFSQSYLFKILAASMCALLTLLVLWNYSEPVRYNAQKLGLQHGSFNFAEHIPAWSIRAKIFRKTNLTLPSTIGGTKKPFTNSDTTLNTPIDALYQRVYEGAWPSVEAVTSGKCEHWVVDHICSVRVWQLAYQGLNGALMPIQSLDLSPKVAVSPRIRAIFLFGKSVTTSGTVSEQFFAEALSAIPKDTLFLEMLFDARFKSLIRQHSDQQISKLITLIPANMNARTISKWRAITNSAKLATPLAVQNPATRSAGMTKLRADITASRGSLMHDPLSLISLGNHAIQLGLAKNFVGILSAFESANNGNLLDPSLRTEVANLYVRALLLNGEKNIALQRLLKMSASKEMDIVSQHLLGSIYLDSQGSRNLPAAATAFRASLTKKNNWESRVGYLLALTRTGQLSAAKQEVITLQRLVTPANTERLTIAFAEYKLAAAKVSESTARATYAEVEQTLLPIYKKHPDWTRLAGLYVNALRGVNKVPQAMKIQSKIDDILSETSYFSSNEKVTSAVGPLALLH